MSYGALVGQLFTITKELQELTKQPYFPVAVDESQVGLNPTDWFPGPRRSGRPLLSAWIWQLSDPDFKAYLFYLIGKASKVPSWAQWASYDAC
jgi:hypothetical protein